MKRPLVWITLFLCLGIVSASLIRISFWLVFLLAIAFLFFSFLSAKKALGFHVFILCSIFFLGVGLLKNYATVPKRHISRYAFRGESNFYVIKGFVNSQPVLKYNKTSFIFKTEELLFDNLKYNCCGDILVYVRGRQNLRYGDELVLSGSLYKPTGNLSNNLRSYRDYLRNQGIFIIAYVKTDAGLVRLNKNRGAMIKKIAFWLKDKTKDIILRHNSVVTASILGAMILGEKKDVPAPIYNSMVSSGTVHILVVSGFNVGIVTFIVILLLKLIRLPRKTRFCLTIPVLIIYCLMTGASNPVVRATIMAVFFMLGYLFKREPDIYNSLSMAATFILALNPLQLFEIGFQLSFASVLSIVYLYPKIKAILRLEPIKVTYLRFLLDGCLVSFSAWLGTAGFIAYYFKMFSPITVLANILIVPLATLITLCGLSLVLIGLICPPLGPIFAYNCELLTALLININAALIRLPGASLGL